MADKALKLKGGNKTFDRRLDRLVEFDIRSRRYPIRELVGDQKPRSYSWACGVTLDQGNEGSCVGHGWEHSLAAKPVVIKGANHTHALKIYNLAKTLDEWAGENYEGTSVLAGAKAVQQMGFMSEYRWAFGIDDLLLALGHHGDAVLGLNWKEGMDHIDEKGFIHNTGNVRGGHCILARAVKIFKKDAKAELALENIDRDKSYVVLHNSWGAKWGDSGDVKISVTDLAGLLSEDGEACIPVKRISKVE